MDRPNEPAHLEQPADPAGHTLGPVGDWLNGEWPAQAAEQIESVVGSIRRKTTGPAIVASRAVVYGIVITVFAILTGLLLLIAVLRGLDALMPTWTVQMLVGAVLSIIGFVCWGRRTSKETVS